MSEPKQTLFPILMAFAVAILSGTVAAFTLEPALQVMEEWGLPDLPALLLPFSVTSGLAFGLCGAAFLIWMLRLQALAASVFLVTSMAGIAAAVYVALVSHDNSAEHFIVPYAVGSPLGALIVAGPLIFLGRFMHPWRTIGLAFVLPTLWAIGVASVVDGDAALEVPGLAALYIGWQGIVLSIFAATERRT